MKAQNRAIEGFSITYGRVAPYVPSHRVRRQSNVVYIVKFFLPDWKPSYAYHGSYLSYEIERTYYKIYNPQQFQFNLEQLKAYIVGWHRTADSVEVVDFEILSS